MQIIFLILFLIIQINECEGKKEWNRPNDGRARQLTGNDGVKTIVFESPTEGICEIGNGEIWHLPIGGTAKNVTAEFEPISKEYIEKKKMELKTGSIRNQGDAAGSIRPFAGNKPSGSGGSIRPVEITVGATTGSIRNTGKPPSGSIRTTQPKKSCSIRVPTGGSIRQPHTAEKVPSDSGSIRTTNTTKKSGSIRNIDPHKSVDVTIRDQKISASGPQIMSKSQMHLKAGMTIRPGDDPRAVPVSKSIRHIYELGNSMVADGAGRSGGGGSIRSNIDGTSSSPSSSSEPNRKDLLKISAIDQAQRGSTENMELLRIENPFVDSIRKGMSLLSGLASGTGQNTWQTYETTREVIDILYEWQPVVDYIDKLCAYMDGPDVVIHFRINDFIGFLVDNLDDPRLPALWKRLAKIVDREVSKTGAGKEQMMLFALLGMNQMLLGNLLDDGTEFLKDKGLNSKLDLMEAKFEERAIQKNRKIDFNRMEGCMELMFSEMAQTFNA